MSTKSSTNFRDGAAPPSSGAAKLRLLLAISALLCVGGLAACSRPLAGPVASVPSSTVSSRAAVYPTSDQISARELARIYPLAGNRPSRASPPRIAQEAPFNQAPPTNKVVQTPAEPEATGAV